MRNPMTRLFPDAAGAESAPGSVLATPVAVRTRHPGVLRWSSSRTAAYRDLPATTDVRSRYAPPALLDPLDMQRLEVVE
jgi:hypothetical protein